MSDQSSIDNGLRKLRIALHLTCLSVTLGLVLAAVFVIYRPLHAEEHRVRSDTTGTQKFLNHQDEVAKDSQQRNVHRPESRTLFPEEWTRIPEAAQKTEFLAQLSQLAAQSEVKIHEFRSGDEVVLKTHRELPIHISGEASYAGLCRFLVELEKVERLTELTALHVSGSYGKADTYPVSMTINIFFGPLSDQKELTAGGEETSTLWFLRF
jgi:Tfp pilus assembly protein PilO